MNHPEELVTPTPGRGPSFSLAPRKNMGAWVWGAGRLLGGRCQGARGLEPQPTAALSW